MLKIRLSRTVVSVWFCFWFGAVIGSGPSSQQSFPEVKFFDPRAGARCMDRSVGVTYSLDFGAHFAGEAVAHICRIQWLQVSGAMKQVEETFIQQERDAIHSFVFIFDDFSINEQYHANITVVLPTFKRPLATQMFSIGKSTAGLDLWRTAMACGQLCNTSIEGQPGPFFDTVTKPMQCSSLWKWMQMDEPRQENTPVPPSIPDEMLPAFTYEGKVQIQYEELTNFYPYPQASLRFESIWRAEMINEWSEMCGNGALDGGYGFDETRWVLEGMRVMELRGKHVLVIGSQTPWMEACALHAGAARITTIEYMEVHSRHPAVSVVTPAEAARRYADGSLGSFDAVLSFSSVEHSGLGRYGDRLNPWGDIITIGRAWCVAKPRARLLLGTESGYDQVRWNLHRLYGPIMFPHLVANWRQLWRAEGGKQRVHVFERAEAAGEGGGGERQAGSCSHSDDGRGDDSP